MYLLALYFQNPDTLAFTPLQAGVATLPATVGLVVLTPMIPRLAARFGGRKVIALGFILMTLGFGCVGLVDTSWKYAAFVLPLVILAVGMGMANGPASSASTAARLDRTGRGRVGHLQHGPLHRRRRVHGARRHRSPARSPAGARRTEPPPGTPSRPASLSRASIALALTCVLGILLGPCWARRDGPRGRPVRTSAPLLPRTRTPCRSRPPPRRPGTGPVGGFGLVAPAHGGTTEPPAGGRGFCEQVCQLWQLTPGMGRDSPRPPRVLQRGPTRPPPPPPPPAGATPRAAAASKPPPDAATDVLSTVSLRSPRPGWSRRRRRRCGQAAVPRRTPSLPGS